MNIQRLETLNICFQIENGKESSDINMRPIQVKSDKIILRNIKMIFVPFEFQDAKSKNDKNSCINL